MIISFEGIDGAGKSTACLSLSVALSKRRVSNILSGSQSLQNYTILRPEIKDLIDLRSNNLLGPLALCLYRAADIATQWENSITKALQAGFLIIADRYIYTPLVRDVLRGIDESYVRELYKFAPEPDLIVYMDLAPEISYRRRIESSGVVSYYECGGEMHSDPRLMRLSFIAFQEQCRQRYLQILPKEKTIIIDSSQSIQEINEKIEDEILGFIRNPARLQRI
jgi:dTMP kinase